MAHDRGSQLRATLRKILPRPVLQEMARRHGAVQRQRKIDVAALVWSLALGFAPGRKRSLAALRRNYERAVGASIEESSFYDRFTPALVALLRAAILFVVAHTTGSAPAFEGPLATFVDVLITDSTVIRLHDLLAKSFPACRTNHTQAALKAHVLLSVRGVSEQSMRITSERVADGPVLKVGRWVRDRLLLFDLGYFRYQLFARITENGGYFVSRLKQNANPLIVAENRRHRGRARRLVGQRLRDVLQGLQRQELDVQVEVEFKRRRYMGRSRGARMTLRLVGHYDKATGTHHLYVTNVPPAKLSAADVAAVYAARWQIELLFKELKSHYRIEDMPSRKRTVVEALFLAAVLTLLVSRRLLVLVREWLRRRDRYATEARWAAVFATFAGDLLQVVTAPATLAVALARHVEKALVAEAANPSRTRRGLLADVQARTHALSRIPA
jgi:IS4 transposase